MELKDYINCTFYQIIEEEGKKKVLIEADFGYSDQGFDYVLFNHYCNGIPIEEFSLERMQQEIDDSDCGAIDWNAEDDVDGDYERDIRFFYMQMNRLDLNQITPDTPCGCYYGEWS